MESGFFKKALTKAKLDRLNQRERLIILGAAGVILCLLIFQFLISPYLNAAQKLDRALVQRKGEVAEMQLLQQEYRMLQEKAGGIKNTLEKRAADFSLFSFLDEQASAAEIKNFISYMKPSTSERSEDEFLESLVEIKLQKVPLWKLVAFLERIESPENVVSIKRISLQENGDDSKRLDVILQVTTFVLSG